MTYKTIQPPFTLEFREMPKAELKNYFRWFLDGLPGRVTELANAVMETQGYAEWLPDYTPSSLSVLGEWLVTQVQTRKRTAEELNEVAKGSPYAIDVPEEELTNRTFSLAMDIGAYLGEVIVREHNCRWDQQLGDKKYADYGQPVVVELRPAPLNPVRIVVTLCYAIASGEQGGQRLRELYDYWAKRVCSEK